MGVGFKFTVDTAPARKRLFELGKAMSAPTVLNAIGNKFLWWWNENFRQEGAESPWAPLSPSTIFGRRGGGGGAKILQDTGRLRMSVVKAVNAAAQTVTVGTEDQRAPWHHLGTQPYEITASGGALRFLNRDGEVIFRKSVHHPGLPVRRLLPTPGLAQTMAFETLNAYVEKLVKASNQGQALPPPEAPSGRS